MIDSSADGIGGTSGFQGLGSGPTPYVPGENEDPPDWLEAEIDPLDEFYQDDDVSEWPDATALPVVPLPGNDQPITDSAKRFGELLAKKRTHFVRGGVVVRVATDKAGNASTEEVKPCELQSDLENVAILAKVTQTLDSPITQQTTCTEQMAKSILACRDFLAALPELTMLSRCPVLIEVDGELRTIVGYDQASGVLAQGSAPEVMDVAQAKELLSEVLKDFQFATPSDRSRALAALITPAMIMSGLLPGRAPLDLGEANKSQTGKGFRHKLTAAIYNQTPHAVTQQKAGVGSMEEAFDRQLIAGKNFILLDNVRGKIDSPKIESFLTEDTYNARCSYSRNMEIDPRRICVMFTSNKADVTPDLANRSSCVRILKQPDSYAFQQYPEGDILDRIRAQQPKYLGAVFAVVRAWHAAGKQRTSDTRHDFRGWARTMDWIVQNILGASPLLDGHKETQERMTNPQLNWLRDVVIAINRQGRASEWLTATDILKCIDEAANVEIPGLRDGDNLEDGPTHTRILQLMGRKFKSCFGDKYELVMDNLGITREAYKDEFARDRFRYMVYPAGEGPVPF